MKLLLLRLASGNQQQKRLARLLSLAITWHQHNHSAALGNLWKCRHDAIGLTKNKGGTTCDYTMIYVWSVWHNRTNTTWSYSLRNFFTTQDPELVQVDRKSWGIAFLRVEGNVDFHKEILNSLSTLAAVDVASFLKDLQFQFCEPGEHSDHSYNIEVSGCN